MGEAKRRGSFEDRVAERERRIEADRVCEARAKACAERQRAAARAQLTSAEREQVIKREVARTQRAQQRTRSLLMVGALGMALAAAAVPPRRRDDG